MFSSVKFGAKYNLAANKIITDAFPHRDFSTAISPCLFFGTPHATVNHIAGVTEMWMSRIYGGGSPKTFDHLYFSHPTGPCEKSLREMWEECDEGRTIEKSLDWLAQVSKDLDTRARMEGEDFLASKVSFTSTQGEDKRILVAAAYQHIFIRNTHYRGQLHAALCAAGVRDCVLDAPAIIDCLSDDFVRK